MAVFRGLPDSAHLVRHRQSHESEGCQRKVRPGSSGGQRARTPTDARRKLETTEEDSNRWLPGYDQRRQVLYGRVQKTAEEDSGC